MSFCGSLYRGNSRCCRSPRGVITSREITLRPPSARASCCCVGCGRHAHVIPRCTLTLGSRSTTTCSSHPAKNATEASASTPKSPARPFTNLIVLIASLSNPYKHGRAQKVLRAISCSVGFSLRSYDLTPNSQHNPSRITTFNSRSPLLRALRASLFPILRRKLYRPKPRRWFHKLKPHRGKSSRRIVHSHHARRCLCPRSWMHQFNRLPWHHFHLQFHQTTVRIHDHRLRLFPHRFVLQRFCQHYNGNLQHHAFTAPAVCAFGRGHFPLISRRIAGEVGRVLGRGDG